MADDDFSVASMAKSIAGSIRDTAAQDLGALIIGQVFPSNDSPPSYFDDVYQQITRIVNAVVTQNDITLISGTLNGVQSWVTDTYGPLKADTASTPTMLHALVEPIADKVITDVIGPLMTDTLAAPGFSVFLLAAGVHLALVQEQAYTDPNHRTNGGYDSPYATSVKKYAQSYYDFIGKVWPTIQSARTNAISAVKYLPSFAGRDFSEVGRAEWQDSIDGTSVTVDQPYGNFDGGVEAIAGATAQRTAHVTAVIAALNTSLGDPDTIAANFLELVTWPLPVSPAKIVSCSASGGGSVSFAGGFQQKIYSFSLSWSTSGGTTSLDGGIGNVAASGSLNFSQDDSPPPLPTTLTVTGSYGPPLTQPINW